MKYKFRDGIFEFYTAQYGSWNNDRRVIFRVRQDTTPEIRAKEKGIIDYDVLFPSNPEDIAAWFKTHYEFKDYEKLYPGGLSLEE